MNEKKWYKIKKERVNSFTPAFSWDGHKHPIKEWLISAVFSLEECSSDSFPYVLKPVPPFELPEDLAIRTFLLLCNLEDLDEFDYEYLNSQV